MVISRHPVVSYVSRLVDFVNWMSWTCCSRADRGCIMIQCGEEIHVPCVFVLTAKRRENSDMLRPFDVIHPETTHSHNGLQLVSVVYCL